MDLFGIGDSINQWIRDFFSNLASEILTVTYKLMSTYIISITNLNRVPRLWELTNWAMTAAQILATIFFIYRIAMSLRDLLTGEAEPNYSEIVGSYVLTFPLIYALPYLILHAFIPVSNSIIQSLSDLGITIQFPKKSAIELVVDPSLGLTQDAMITIFLAVFLAVAMIALGFSAVIRYAEIALIYLISPLIATSYTNRSDVLRVFFIETTAVVFTQPLHFLFLYWIMNSITQGLLGVMLSFGLVVLAVRGPRAIRQFIYTSGASGFLARTIGGTSRIAVYKYLARNVGK